MRVGIAWERCTVANVKKEIDINNIPNVGDSIDLFINCFGQPVQVSGSVYTFNIMDGDSDYSHLVVNASNCNVNNISFSINVPNDGIGIELFANQFLPYDLKKITKVENKVIKKIDEDNPISIYEYFSLSLLNNQGYFDVTESGYITVYICNTTSYSTMTVALGREEVIQ